MVEPSGASTFTIASTASSMDENAPEPKAPRMAAPNTVHSRSRVTFVGWPMTSVMTWAKPSDLVPPPVEPQVGDAAR